MPAATGYNAAADFNQDGIVNQIDAKALEQNMPPYTKHPLNLVMNLTSRRSGSLRDAQNSGRHDVEARTSRSWARTLPGSIVIQDGTQGYYKWTGPAYATNANGYFTAPEKLTQGINTFNFLIIDPSGQQLVRTFPIFWLPFAAPGSKLK